MANPENMDSSEYIDWLEKSTLRQIEEFQNKRPKKKHPNPLLVKVAFATLGTVVVVGGIAGIVLVIYSMLLLYKFNTLLGVAATIFLIFLFVSLGDPTIV